MAKARRQRPAPRPLVKDRFAVIPIRPENVEERRDSRGLIHLRLTAPQPKGLAQKIAKLLRYNYTRTLELDEYGTYFYEQVDGETTLETIVTRMTEKLGTDREQAAESVVLFVKKLMTMSLLALKVPADEAGEESR